MCDSLHSIKNHIISGENPLFNNERKCGQLHKNWKLKWLSVGVCGVVYTAVMNYNPECCAVCSLGSELLLMPIYINSWRFFKALCSSLNKVAAAGEPLTWDVPHIQTVMTGFLWFSSLHLGQWWVKTLDHTHFHPKPFQCIIHCFYHSAHSDSIKCKLLYSIS